jgi:enoyl-CoA hydratase
VIHLEDLSDTVSRITIDNPPVNAIGVKDAWALGEMFDGFSRRTELRTVIMRSIGRGFCAGLDIKEMERAPGMTLMAEAGAAFEACFSAMDRCPVPVIVSVNGFCMGVGLGLIACSDIVVAAPGTQFGVPEEAWGVSHLARLVLPMKLRQMVLTGEPVTAEDLQSYGSIYCITPAESLDQVCEQLARRLELQSTVSVRIAKAKLVQITSLYPTTKFRDERDRTLYDSGPGPIMTA